MNGFVDIYTIIFLVLAVVIFLRLRGVLGRRTGNERPPFDPYAQRREASRRQQPGTEKVISLPQRRPNETVTVAPPSAEETAAAEARIRTIAQPGSSLGDGLRAIVAADRSFDPDEFLKGARVAYEMIVTAFADGDRTTLRPLLARDVFDNFVAAINDRETRGESIDFKFVGIERAEIVDAALRNGNAQVKVRFASKSITATKSKDGKVIDGDATKVEDVTDLWTFAREVASKNPNWKLVATEE